MLSQIGHKLPQMTFLMHIPTFFHLSLSSLQSSLFPCLLLWGCFFFFFSSTSSLLVHFHKQLIWCVLLSEAENESRLLPGRPQWMSKTGPKNVNDTKCYLDSLWEGEKNLFTPPPNTSSEQTSQPFFNPLRKKRNAGWRPRLQLHLVAAPASGRRHILGRFQTASVQADKELEKR